MKAEDFFNIAIKEAEKASMNNEVPIGAVLVKNGAVLAKNHNRTESKGSFFAHAEILCLEKASKKINSKYLVGCELYVTVEPCQMCRFAARLCRIDAIHYLLSSDKFGVKGRGYSKIKIRKSKSDLSRNALILLREFFQKKR